MTFGFSEQYEQLIRRLHTGTTATFLVNGEKSDPFPVVSGIRQGCPLAPLLFLIVVELLGIAIQQSPILRVLPVPGGTGGRHTFSAFVDDSTIFLDKACQLDHAEELHDHLLTYLMWARCRKSPEPGYERRSRQRIVAVTRVGRVSTGLLNQ